MSKFILCGLVILFIVVIAVHYKNMEGFVVSGDYTIETFTQLGKVHTWKPPVGLTTIQILVVGGGGGGGSGHINGYPCGGGGGGGCVIYKDSQNVSENDTYQITIGGGGQGGGQGPGMSGGGSRITGQTVSLEANGGGGGGGGSTANGLSGGSGGGGVGASSGTGGTGGVATKGLSNTSSIGKGNNGGAGKMSSFRGGGFGSGGGGGGAGSVGTSTNDTDAYGGKGGNGLDNNISGTNTFYGAGGGGAVYMAGWPADSASGVGGKGGEHSSGNRPDGIPFINGTMAIGYGNGGGGGSTEFSGSNKMGTGGNGSAGIVIIKYKTPVAPYVSNYTKKPNTDVAGRDISCGEYKTHADIENACNSKPECVGYSFYNFNNGLVPHCLKTNVSDTHTTNSAVLYTKPVAVQPVDNTAINAATAEIAALKLKVSTNTSDIEIRKKELESATKALTDRLSLLEIAKKSGDTAAEKQAASDVSQAKTDKDNAALELQSAIAQQKTANKNLADATANIEKMSKDATSALNNINSSSTTINNIISKLTSSSTSAENDAKSASMSAEKAAADAKSISDAKAAIPIIIISQKVNNNVMNIMINTTDGSTINNANIVYNSSIPVLSRGQSSNALLHTIKTISSVPSVTNVPLDKLKDGYKYYVINSDKYTEGTTKLLGSFQYFKSTTDFNIPEITSQYSKPDSSCNSLTRTDIIPDTSESDCTNTATELQEHSSMLENAQTMLKNNILSARCTTPLTNQPLDNTTTSTTQGKEYNNACYKRSQSRCPKNPDGTCPPIPDMSNYIKKDEIPCWGCSIDY